MSSNKSTLYKIEKKHECVYNEYLLKLSREGLILKPCRECNKEISENAVACPHCGAPYPAKEKWDGWGFEYRSKTQIGGLPLLHISFKYRKNFMPVPARGIIAIGQFAAGLITIAQFGVGIVGICQIGIGGWLLAQFAIAWTLLAQLGIFLHSGRGQLVISVMEALEKLAGLVSGSSG